jgi:hypothetical protein
MKKIIGIIFVSLIFANIGFAEIREIESKKVSKNWITTYCIDGYKFVEFYKEGRLSGVQFYERVGGVSLPAQC